LCAIPIRSSTNGLERKRRNLRFLAIAVQTALSTLPSTGTGIPPNPQQLSDDAGVTAALLQCRAYEPVYKTILTDSTASAFFYSKWNETSHFHSL